MSAESGMPDNLSILLLDGENKLAVYIAQCLAAAEGNFKLHIFSDEPWGPVRFSRHRKSYIVCKENEDERLLERIKETVRKNGVDMILPAGEPGTHFAALHRDELTTLTRVAPGPSVESFETIHNKWLMSEFLAEAQIPTPITVLHTADDSFQQQITGLTFPVLMKPAAGKSGGVGIQRFDQLDDLLAYLDEHDLPPGEYLIQEFIPGYDIDASFLSVDGKILAYTVQRGFLYSPKPYAPPAGIRFLHDDQITDVITRAAAALKWSGVAHVDMRFDERDGLAKIVEINPRYWGSLLGSLKAGINFPYLHILAGYGIEFPRPEYQEERFVATEMVLLPELKKFLKRGHFSFKLKDTDLNYMLNDPMASLYRLSLQGTRFFFNKGGA